MTFNWFSLKRDWSVSLYPRNDRKGVHQAAFTGPGGLRVEVKATGPSGCGKSITIDAIEELVTHGEKTTE